MTDFSALNNQLHQEADDLLYGKGLHAILEQYGKPHYTGSYELQLMTWRDLDIYLETNITTERFFRLGSEIAALLSPVKMSFRNELLGKTAGLPEGLYWGIYLGNERQGAWKIDLWAMTERICAYRLAYGTELKQKLTLTNSEAIMKIKEQCWQDPSYRKKYSSSDIYDAVLNHSITDIDSFRTYLRAIASDHDPS